MKQKYVIFDLDGTLCLIDKRRELSKLNKNKIDWDIFFDPKNIWLDEPNIPIITMFQHLKTFGYKMFIFSGRLDITLDVTKQWLKKHEIFYDKLVMRSSNITERYVKDSILKEIWLNKIFPGEEKNNIFCIFDDRDQVVKMWRSYNLTCLQVNFGDF